MVENLEQQSYNSELPVGNYVPYFNQQDQTDRPGLIRELSPNNSIINVIDILRGIVRNPRNPSDTRKINTLVNEEGIAIFTIMVTSGANEINTFSNYRNDTKFIYSLMQKWILDIVYEFHFNRKKYGIPEESQSSIVINLAIGLILPSFFKALGAGDRNSATRAVQESIVRSMRDDGQQQNPVKRRSLLSRMIPFYNG